MDAAYIEEIFQVLYAHLGQQEDNHIAYDLVSVPVFPQRPHGVRRKKCINQRQQQRLLALGPVGHLADHVGRRGRAVAATESQIAATREPLLPRAH